MRPGSSSAERSYHGPNGKTPGSAKTPRKEASGSNGGHGRERALQDPGLKDYVRGTHLPSSISS